jgi:predicted CopG family antitoxin
MARVQIDDETWRQFRAVAGVRSISEVLGELVEREVRRARSTRLRDGTLTDREVVEALARARDQAEDLQAIVTRLESLREP